ncbi:MAG TPA: ATPase domain-containing protein [Thermomicrobiales bacterium]|nr:ATPase domain-containing protein [Thermomicrobiales bacterium]
MVAVDQGLLSTGVPGLDLVLGGGIHQGSIVLFVGVPGSGKTILAQQIAHHRASQGDRVLFLIGFSETQDKLIAHGRSMDFFVGSHLGREIQFGNLADLLRAGIEETEDTIVAMARQQRARLVILDGFSSMRRSLPDEPTPGALLYSLGNKLSLLGATTIVTTEGDLRRIDYEPEYTVADAIIGLGRMASGFRDRRVLDVNKVRGAAPLLGRHPFTIDTRGITIYPRLETVARRRLDAWSPEVVPFGIPGLDTILGGGITAGSSTVVAGSPGTGKTLLSLHFLAEGARRNEPSLLVEFIEDVVQIRAQARAFGLDGPIAGDGSVVELLGLPAYEMEPDEIAHQICERLDTNGVRRLVIDSANELARAIDPIRQADFFAALIDILRSRGVTSLFTFDVPSIVGTDLTFANSPLAGLAENLLLLRQLERHGSPQRALAVLKRRFGAADHVFYPYSIQVPIGFEVVTIPAFSDDRSAALRADLCPLGANGE